jgi:hypothetical protein
MAERWARGVYQQGHLYMFPNQATGRFPYSVIEYPAFQKKWNARSPAPKANGVIAGTANHAGHFPRTEITIKDGFVVDAKGSGVYADVWREFLKYPRINEVTYPYHDRPGYWLLYEAALGDQSQILQTAGREPVGRKHHRAKSQWRNALRPWNSRTPRAGLAGVGEGVGRVYQEKQFT